MTAVLPPRHSSPAALLCALLSFGPAFGDDPAAAGHPGVLLAEAGYDVVATVDGKVHRVGAGLGDAVRDGDTIVELDDSELKRDLDVAVADLEAARAAREQASFRRVSARESHERRSAQPEFFSDEEIRAAEMEVREASAAFESASAHAAAAAARFERARDRLRGARVTAPVAGTVAALYVESQGYVRQGMTVARISVGPGLLVRFAVSPERAESLRPGDAVTVAVMGGAVRALRGVVTRVAPEVDSPSGLVFAEAVMEQDVEGMPRAGSAVRVMLSAAGD